MKVQLDHVSVMYKDDDHAVLAADRVDLALSPGRVTALVGESGSGKTTLAKALMGLLPENAEVTGQLLLDDTRVAGGSEAALNRWRWTKIAMVFQNGSDVLNPVYKLVDQVAEPLVQHAGLSKKEARKAALAKLSEMGVGPELASRYPHELSGGQLQRGLVAMATILDPPVVILDEPTAALDAVTKSFVAQVIQQLRNSGKSILLITHDLELARHLADDTAVLYMGQVVETMPGGDLLDHPQHPYTMALARSYPAMDAVRDLGGVRGDGFYRLVHAHARNHENGQPHKHTHVAGSGHDHEDGHAPPSGCLFRPRCTQAVDACRMGDIPMTEAGTHRLRCLRGGIVTLLQLSGVEKSYKDVRALSPLDVGLAAGEVFCVVGETGSGKTTLAMIAAGALEPDNGGRMFEDRDMAAWIKEDYRTLASRIGMIHQHPREAVSHRFTVFDIVAEPLRIRNGRLDPETGKEKVIAALSDVHLSTASEFLKKYPHELNMGAVQRVCMARAIVDDPVFLVADEPTSALDPGVQAKVLKMLLQLQIEKGLTMLFVTHDIGLARKIGDRIGVMLDGRLVEVGPAARIINRPGHPYTKMLIESAKSLAPINTFGTRNGIGKNGGCPFTDRCESAMDKCGKFPSTPVNLDGGRHLTWCRYPLIGGRKENPGSQEAAGGGIPCEQI